MKSPKVVFVNPGSCFALDANVQGTRPATAAWSVNGSVQWAGPCCPAFTVCNVHKSDSGSYQLQVKNMAGSAVSAVVEVRVNGADLSCTY